MQMVCGEKMYTVSDVCKILCVEKGRIKSAVQDKNLKVSDIVPSGGRYGYRNLFSANDIRNYANKVGLTPVFDAVGSEEDEIDENGAITLTPENFDRVVHHGKPIGKVTATETEDGVLFKGTIMPDGEEVYEGQTNDICEEVPVVPEVVKDVVDVERYVIRVGKAYVSVRQNNELYFQITPDYNDFISFKLEEVERAKEIANLLGGKVYKIFLEEVE